MPSTSKSQQRLMGMVHAHQKGELKSPSKQVSRMAMSMPADKVVHFAATKHSKLPERKGEPKKGDKGRSAPPAFRKKAAFPRLPAPEIETAASGLFSRGAGNGVLQGQLASLGDGSSGLGAVRAAISGGKQLLTAGNEWSGDVIGSIGRQAARDGGNPSNYLAGVARKAGITPGRIGTGVLAAAAPIGMYESAKSHLGGSSVQYPLSKPAAPAKAAPVQNPLSKPGAPTGPGLMSQMWNQIKGHPKTSIGAGLGLGAAGAAYGMTRKKKDEDDMDTDKIAAEVIRDAVVGTVMLKLAASDDTSYLGRMMALNAMEAKSHIEHPVAATIGTLPAGLAQNMVGSVAGPAAGIVGGRLLKPFSNVMAVRQGGQKEIEGYADDAKKRKGHFGSSFAHGVRKGLPVELLNGALGGLAGGVLGGLGGAGVGTALGAVTGHPVGAIAGLGAGGLAGAGIGALAGGALGAGASALGYGTGNAAADTVLGRTSDETNRRSASQYAKHPFLTGLPLGSIFGSVHTDDRGPYGPDGPMAATAKAAAVRDAVVKSATDSLLARHAVREAVVGLVVSNLSR